MTHDAVKRYRPSDETIAVDFTKCQISHTLSQRTPIVIVCTITCEKNIKKLLANADKSKPNGVEFLYFTGNYRLHSAVSYEKHIILPTQDGYYYSVNKVRQAFQYCLETYRNFKYLFKCDDDTIVNFDNLYNFANNSTDDYIGHLLELPDERPSFAAGGCGYLVSRKFTQFIVQKMNWVRGEEDVSVGVLAKMCQIQLVHNNNLLLVEPEIKDDIIAYHVPHAKRI